MTKISDAILLVAGVGARLRPLTDTAPKCLLEVGETSLIVRLLTQLKSLGIEHVVLATGYMDHLIKEALCDVDGLPRLSYGHNPHYAETNNAQSLKMALPHVEGRAFLLCDGDVLLGSTDSLQDLIDHPRENVLMMVARDDMGDEEMKIQMNGQGEVLFLSKQLDPVQCQGESLGLQKIGRSIQPVLSERLESMNAEQKYTLYYEDIFAQLIGEGHGFYTSAVATNSWTEIDTVEDYELAKSLYQSWDKE